MPRRWRSLPSGLTPKQWTLCGLLRHYLWRGVAPDNCVVMQSHVVDQCTVYWRYWSACSLPHLFSPATLHLLLSVKVWGDALAALLKRIVGRKSTQDALTQTLGLFGCNGLDGGLHDFTIFQKPQHGEREINSCCIGMGVMGATVDGLRRYAQYLC